VQREYSFLHAGINGFDLSERFLQLNTRSFGYAPDEDFGA
jgi:hypothetical protein